MIVEVGALPASATSAVWVVAGFVWGVRVFADRPAVGLGLPFLMFALGQAAGALVAGAAIGVMGHPAAFASFAGLALATTLVRPTGSDDLPGEPTIIRAGSARR